MPLITVSGTDYVLEASPAVSLLNILLQAGIKISHLCGGKAVCGTCRVSVISGAENLSPVKKAERIRLDEVKAKPDQRLACQTYVKGDIEIRIPGLKTNLPE